MVYGPTQVILTRAGRRVKEMFDIYACKRADFRQRLDKSSYAGSTAGMSTASIVAACASCDFTALWKVTMYKLHS